MSKITLDEDQLNMEIRKFLKTVGVTSQREIERALRSAAEQGTLGTGGIKATITLEIPELGLVHKIKHELHPRSGA
ncbi:MAG: DUF6494 family protein [Gammaproteobacteria bacterium]|jgi:hypothetical protein|nr:DUF6494 family protein [Gammaproteobacteria bacterium]